MGRYSGTDLPPDALRLFQRATWGLNQWTAIVAVLGFARRLAPGDSPALRYLTAAVFPIYILHQTAIVVFAHNLKPLTIAPIVDAPLLALARTEGRPGGTEGVRPGRPRWAAYH